MSVPDPSMPCLLACVRLRVYALSASCLSAPHTIARFCLGRHVICFTNNVHRVGGVSIMDYHSSSAVVVAFCFLALPLKVRFFWGKNDCANHEA
ncbi:hypothetical protein P167DRAFT_187140 [Morchella conica CCBAS932]|uniref:Uncharacterized protein n=1 Tax=Morchella conica CCBAS932 TaxID=1392247 RepID=A0A3N4KMI0_9PEZI|nr:hypothetical protein P167DRAFT_187140 [Morchella conica CCBAS932]